MFSTPFGRILWKEYRANQPLWLACLLIGVVVQLTTTISMLGYNSTSRADGLIMIAAIIPVMYAIGCGAIMFASEREDGTSDWLLTLSAPPLPTLLGKASFAVVSTIALQIVMFLVSLIFIAGAKPDFWWPVIVPMGALTLIWSSFGSLLSRRVLSSVFIAAIWLFLSTFALQTIFDYLPYIKSYEMSNARWHIGWWINSLLTLGLNCWLGWRWCHASYVDGEVVENFMAQTRTFGNKLTRVSGETQRLPLTAEYDQSWRRSWQRLVWQERHRSRIPITLLQVVCALDLLMIPIFLIVGEKSSACGVIWFCVWAICFITPITMGWLSYQVDSSLQQPRFLVNRGISHSLIWFVKQYVWLTRAIFIPMAMAVVSTITICLLSGNDRSNILRGLIEGSAFIRPYDTQQFLWIHRGIWYVLLTYACGQLASLLFRRTVIAIAASGFFLYLVGLWSFLLETCQLPLSVMLGLPFLAMLFITFWQMKPWLLEDQSWLRKLKVAGALTAIPVGLLIVLCVARVGEVYFVHRVDPSFVSGFEAQCQVMANWKSEALLNKSTVDRLIQLSQSTENDAVAKIVELINQNQPHKKCFIIDNIPFDSVNQILLKRSRQLQDEGQLEEALKVHLTSLRIARAIGEGTTFAWMAGASNQRSTFEELITWANHPNQTPDSLRNGIQQIENELQSYPSFNHAVVDSYVENVNDWVLASRDEVFLRLLEHNVRAPNADQLMAVLFLLPTERIRTSMLLARDAEMNYASSFILESELASPLTMFNRGLTFVPYPTLDTELDHLEWTTPLARINRLTLSSTEKLIKNRQMEKRAALVRLNLIAYRLEHGKLPDQLIQLLPAINGAHLIDPWSGQMFEYYPTFLYSRGPEGAALFPVNSNEFAPIKPLDVLHGVGFDPSARIYLTQPAKEVEGSEERTSQTFHNKSTLQIFSIPASSKLQQN